MSKNTAAAAVAYYTAFSEKQFEEMEKHLHPGVRFSGPLAQLTGKEAVIEASKKFASFFKALSIRSSFSSEDQAMIVYDLDCPAPVGNFPAAVLLTFHEGLIVKMELFYDGRLFERKKEEIFSN